MAWELTHGQIPEGSHVLHRCDNPPCVRLDHLFLGDHADNMEDMTRKGRRASLKGERSSTAKLAVQDVKVIREWAEMVGIDQMKPRKRSAAYKEKASEYGLTPQAVRAVVNRRTWKHV